MWSGSIFLFLGSLTAFYTANWFNAKGQKTLQELTPRERETFLLISEFKKTGLIIKQD